MDSINLYEKRIFSQNGEDGILEELFSRIGTINRYFVEFGVQSGLECMAKNLVCSHHWSGVMIEGHPLNYQHLRANYASFPNVITHYSFITRENITEIFSQLHVPREFDLLSIDIDGIDYWVWRELAAYKPRVVIMEYNASFPPPLKMVVAYDPQFMWNGTTYFGASLTSLTELGKQLGYALIGTDWSGPYLEI
ncbi:hypothetical protein BRE01_47980 [Brevibacillus reuszeri]|uniref:Methyltransferase FkbM domain-containing protein n=1 Tax=Brevibacillus reuszeri TaxID=54915 RepID=A0ABQ0TTE2_9BACL|nr:hypothetical protein [Brevibacillus reuszeri]MED1860019.1 hypothetical protein [Brevibacillus reuszeri]GED71096.1 hypothetical protein BRE01_47980 [Brevibacillus reuszeri]